MSGILTLAYKLLVTDKTKFTALVGGITFAVFLMVFVTSMLIGVLNHSASMVTNVGAPVWVMDPSVQNIATAIGLPDYVLDAVRSMQGVKYAVPLYSSGALVKLADGTYQPVTVIGLDDTSLLGRPEMIEGKIEDIYATDAFIALKDADFPKLGSVHLGSQFELNDHRVAIVGIAKVPLFGIFGVPTLYTTYSRALQDVPNPRYTTSYVLVQPKSESDIPRIKQQVKALGYLALTMQEFKRKVSTFYLFSTGLGINIGLMTLISIVIGIAVSGQTFYTFVLENLERYGALKAIGTTSRELIGMILFQAAFASLVGYGLGVGVCTMIIGLAKLKMASYAGMEMFTNLGAAFVMVLVIAATSSYIGIRTVLRIEPFDIFRG
ncbi:MAG: ABC transporter permease [Candidatus Acidiferrales bacterium]